MGVTQAPQFGQECATGAGERVDVVLEPLGDALLRHGARYHVGPGHQHGLGGDGDAGDERGVRPPRRDRACRHDDRAPVVGRESGGQVARGVADDAPLARLRHRRGLAADRLDRAGASSVEAGGRVEPGEHLDDAVGVGGERRAQLCLVDRHRVRLAGLRLNLPVDVAFIFITEVIADGLAEIHDHELMFHRTVIFGIDGDLLTGWNSELGRGEGKFREGHINCGGCTSTATTGRKHKHKTQYNW